MSLPLRLPYFAPEEYFSLERVSEIRHEYLDGCVYAMAGESPTHSAICFNLAVFIGQQIRDTPCRGFPPNMKVRAGEGALYAYPDLAVACGEPLFHDQHGDVLLNPAVIFEVLSPSTEAYDRGEKFARYRALETLTDYVLVAQDRPRVEHFSRQPDGSWSQTELSGADATLVLDSINCRVALTDIYDRVAFPRQ
jgi:Uma2 family endonuclease